MSVTHSCNSVKLTGGTNNDETGESCHVCTGENSGTDSDFLFKE